MERSSKFYDEAAVQELGETTGPVTIKVFELHIRRAQVFATLAVAAATAEQTKVLEGLIINGQLTVWCKGVK